MLDAKIVLPEGFDKDNFNVVVIQECTPVVYDASGNATADWTTVYSDYQETDGGSGADVVGLDENAGGQGGNAGAGNQGEGAGN